jgi:peptide chain release factor 2
LPAKQKRSDEINKRMEEAGFWDNQTTAQALVGELRRITQEMKPVRELIAGRDELNILLEFAEEDPSSEAELRTVIDSIAVKLEAVELQAMLSRPEDSLSAFLSIQAGEGGTDASDWASMMLRMYQRWAEDHGFKSEIADISEAEEAGIRSATIEITGDYVYGKLRSEVGTHRLIRISPFDSAARRQTSFAAVDLTPVVDDSVNIEIDWERDIREDVFRSSGAGGQKVNKTSSAIRLTHTPTGVVVQCQNERSQHKNRALAQKMLIAKLFQIEQNKREAESAAKRGEKKKIGFGGETIRSYVLAPQQYVKDHRTMCVVGNPGKVLDGTIDDFIESYLRWQIGAPDPKKSTAPVIDDE